jgi:hypothetical protein
MPGTAWAGSFHEDTFPAKVLSAEVVVGYVLQDPFVTPEPPAPPSAPPERPADAGLPQTPERSRLDALRKRLGPPDAGVVFEPGGLGGGLNRLGGLGAASGLDARDEPPPEPPRPKLVHPKARVCRVRVQVQDSFWRSRNPVSLYGSPELCERVKANEAVRLQYYGLADMYRFVSIRLGAEWFRLPLMRETRHVGFQRCFEGKVTPTGPHDDFAEDCRRLTHPRSL